VTRDSRSQVEDRTRAWLEESFLRSVAGLREQSEPYDAAGQPRHMTRYHFQELQRKLRIFSWLDRCRFESFIDVGSGFDVYPQRVAERYGVPAFYSDLVPSMNLPFGGASFGRLDRAVTLNLESLPFRDAAFDVVLASEVLEHLVRPVEAIAELMRITRKVLVMTSLEALSVSRWERWLAHLMVDVRVPHVERNFFIESEIEAIFGPGVQHGNLLHDPSLPVSAFAPAEQQDAAYAALRSIPALVEALQRSVRETRHVAGAMGILIVKPVVAGALDAGRPAAEAQLASWLIERTAAFHHAIRRLAEQIVAGTADLPERDRPIGDDLRERLQCPDCRTGALAPRGSGLACTACPSEFRGEYGVPVLYPTRPRDPEVALKGALDRLCGSDRGRRRAVQRLALRLRRNEDPPGPLRRAARMLEPHLSHRR
jgi:SAM-dependent methyltransferase